MPKYAAIANRVGRGLPHHLCKETAKTLRLTPTLRPMRPMTDEAHASIRRSVIEFAVLVERMTQRLLATTHGVLSDISLVQAKNSGTYPREGRIANALYSFHGSGCRIELDSGEIVDFDLAADDSSFFDEFRLRSFMESRSEEWDPAAVAEVLKELVESRVLSQPRSGWYRLA